ncbi:MAG TPA: YihY/virulence factor BrkB family protein [Burkholderiales bacterium]|jgi:membrane protein|nr:YihY/virulence factor BrkB family protein [Burkholderiales bacterium]
MNLRPTLTLLKRALAAWWNDQAPSKGAALAYYSMFSIAPLLFILISIAGLFFGVDAVRGVVFAQVADLMGENGAEAIQEMLANVSEPATGRWAAALSTAVLVFGATSVFGQLQTALDTIWEVPAQAESEKRNAVWMFIKGRLLSFGLVLALAFLVVVSLVLSAALSALGKWWGTLFGEWTRVAHAFDLAVSFGMLVVVFAAIYKVMPRARIEWRDVWTGAAVTAALFTVGKFLIGLYLGKSDIGSSFGAFGSLVIVMVWVYYSAQIFLLGAEFTWVYAHQSGSRNRSPSPPRGKKKARLVGGEHGPRGEGDLVDRPLVFRKSEGADHP